MMQFMLCEYLEGGREYPFLDCYGLVLAVRRNLGMHCPAEYADVRVGERMDSATRNELPSFRKCDPEHGAIAICWRMNIVRHIAIVVNIGGELRVMECNPHKNTTHCTIADFERKYKRVEYYT